MTIELLLGCYTDPHGTGQGVGSAQFVDGAFTPSGVLAEVDSPSFVATHPRLDVIYAVSEFAGSLLVIVDGRAVQELPAGEQACHVRVDDDGSGVTVACWGDGAVLHYLLDEDGLVTATLTAPPVAGVAETRAHCSVALPGGFVTTDLGADLLRRWKVTEAGLVEVDRLQLPQGVGPRHLVAHEEWLFVVTEYSCEVLVVGWPGALELVGRHDVRARGKADGDTAAEIAHVGDWVTVTVRGSDVLAVLKVVDDQSQPVIELEAFAEVPTGGATPRHHSHVPGAILVSNQLSNEVTVLPFDEATGKVGQAEARIAVGSPTHVLRVG